MSASAPGVPIAFVYFYQFGVRLRQTEVLHGNVTGLRRAMNRALPEHVRSMLLRLAHAVDDLMTVVGTSDLKETVGRAVRAVETDWDSWARSEGHSEALSAVPQSLEDLGLLIRRSARRLGERAEAARAWLRLGQAIVDVYLDRVSRAGGDRPDDGSSLPRIRDNEDEQFEWIWARPSDLLRLLREAGVELGRLFPEQKDERLSLVGLPEDYLGWHCVEAGLQGLLRLAAHDANPPERRPDLAAHDAKPPERRPDLAEQRNKRLYEQSFDTNKTWEALASAVARENPSWPRLSTKQGAQLAAQRYAKRHNLPPPPQRQNR
jgi:hypothetical protein